MLRIHSHDTFYLPFITSHPFVGFTLKDSGYNHQLLAILLEVIYMIGFEFIPEDGDNINTPFHSFSTQLPSIPEENDLSVTFAKWLWKDTFVGYLLGLNNESTNRAPSAEPSTAQDLTEKTPKRRIGHYFKSQF